ncbi:DUF5676 family membrane protein [Marinicella rhabdoformis]|uniref:DUF5676 family membrane protein n=1 Tax=Marinicella rhabdoformis TaxID=2580566 RepID=UPI0012AED532|nr:DUF5676 family membrane protein [Marinicella rhabdoformis]
MNHKISLKAVGHATSILLAATFTICVIFDLIFPDHAMYKSWIQLLPGVQWISWQSFFLGLIETYAYGWYFALIWVPLYNYFSKNPNKKS